jgi:hypothetical protein
MRLCCRWMRSSWWRIAAASWSVVPTARLPRPFFITDQAPSQPVIPSSRATAGSTGAPGPGADARAGGAIGVDALGGGDLLDQLGHPGDQGVDLVQDDAGGSPWCGSNLPSSASALPPQPPRGHRERRGVGAGAHRHEPRLAAMS